jgi:hypothetical protein
MSSAACDVLVNIAVLHHKYPPNGCDVFQRIAIDLNDVRLKARRNRADLIGLPSASATRTLAKNIVVLRGSGHIADMLYYAGDLERHFLQRAR